MRPQIVKICFSVLFMLYGALLFGQSGKAGPPPPGPQRTPQLPIDQDLAILFLLGMVLGIFFLARRIRATYNAR
jgi:hypothetical protein